MSRPMHTRDEDCAGHIDAVTESCRLCGVDHSVQCPSCGGFGFHRERCPESDATIIAAVGGTEGNRPVVWGLGVTEEEARACAERWLSGVGKDIDDVSITFHGITEEEAGVVEAGNVFWPIGEGRAV